MWLLKSQVHGDHGTVCDMIWAKLQLSGVLRVVLVSPHQGVAGDSDSRGSLSLPSSQQWPQQRDAAETHCHTRLESGEDAREREAPCKIVEVKPSHEH